MPIQQLGSVVLYGIAGLCVFLILLNRKLILLPDSKTKGRLILAVFAVFTGGSALLGRFFFRPPWIFAPGALLLFVLLGIN